MHISFNNELGLMSTKGLSSNEKSLEILTGDDWGD